MSNLSERLHELMQEKEINQSELGKALNIPHANISTYYLGTSAPSYNNFLKLLYFFNCSADYLLGRTELHTEEKLLTVPPFNTQFKAVLKIFGASQEQLKRDLSFSSSKIYKWVSGKSEPSTESLEKLADYFECSVDFIIGRTN